MKKLFIIFIAVLLIISLVACEGGGRVSDVVQEPPADLPADPPTDLPADPGGVAPPVDVFTFTLDNLPVIDGSTATIPLIEAVYSVLLGIPRAQAAEMVNTSGTDNAFDSLLWGDAELLLVYSPSPFVLAYARENDIGLEMAPIGRDGLVFLVNVVNPVGSLTPEQIVSIYSGQTRNWREVGGDDVEIRAFQRPYRSGSQTMMDELVMQGVPMAQIEEAFVISEMGGLIEAVALFDNAQSAIGYNVYYFVSRMEMNENVRMLAVNGVQPSTQSISDGSYPFVLNFYAVIREDTPLDSPARVLFDWIQSEDGRNLVQHEGYATAD